MPADFDKCYKNGGRVRTIKLSATTYKKVCYDKEGRHQGHVETKKTK